MSIFIETRNSRSGNVNPPTESREYKLTGYTDEAAARVYAVANTPAYIDDERGRLYRQDVQMSKMGHAGYTITVPYAPRKKQAGQYTLSFDTTGGTIHITNSKETIGKYARPGEPAPIDNGGAIGVHGDEVDGTDAVVPSLKLTVSYKHPTGIITLAQIKNLARWTGKFNSAPFLTFGAGEVLFLGCTGSEGEETETSVTYQFACSESVNNLPVGDIIVADKKGWEYSWIAYEDFVDNGQPGKRPKWVYVERIYEPINLAAALGFGA